MEPVFGERMGEGELATGRCGAAVEGRQSHRQIITDHRSILLDEVLWVLGQARIKQISSFKKSLINQPLNQMPLFRQSDTMQEDSSPFFPQEKSLPTISRPDLMGIQFMSDRLDLQVYHLAYGTKRLRPSTIRRMEKRQDRKNKAKASKAIVKTPEQLKRKGEKASWLEKIDKIVRQNNLKTPTTITKKGRRVKITKIPRRGYRSPVFSIPAPQQPSRVLRLTNSPFMNPTPTAPDNNKTPIPGFGNDQDFPSLL